MSNAEIAEYPQGGFKSLAPLSQGLLGYARRFPDFLGKQSAYRKFCRRNRGLEYRVHTEYDFWFSGEVGDSVDNQIAVWRHFEPRLSQYFLEHAAEWKYFVDLGCNVGYFSCLAGATNRELEMIAIDANPKMVERCGKNLKLNKIEGDVEHCAIGPEAGKLTFSVPKNRHSLGTLGAFKDKKSEDLIQFEVEVKRLEDVVLKRFPRIDFLKVDIEGYEATVFKGFSPELVNAIGGIVFEYSEKNMNNCGFDPRLFDDVKWFADFELHSLDDETGKMLPLKNLSALQESEGTIFAFNKNRTSN